jgi:hypothetical protein
MSVLLVGMPGAGTPGLPANAGADEVLVAALEALGGQEAVGARHGVLVVAPAAHARATEIARAVAGRAGIAQVQPSGPTTQLALVSAVLLQHPELTPGDALAVVHEVPRHVVTHAVLSSVAGLGAPRPTIWQHVASWAPWTRFWVDATEGTITSAAQRPTSAHSYLSSTLDPGTAPKLVADDLLPAGAAPLETLEDPVGDRWGTPRFVERSYLTTPATEVVDTALAVRARACANCDRPTRGSRCDFCGVVRTDRKVTA